MAKTIKRKNNLTIKYDKNYQYIVVAPDKRILEDRMTLEQAEEFCKNTLDFKMKKKEPKITDIDNLCDIINTKRGLKSNEIGTLEHINSMTENSIVRIDNEHRGCTQLIYGEDKLLIKYLQGILEEINNGI